MESDIFLGDEIFRYDLQYVQKAGEDPKRSHKKILYAQKVVEDTKSSHRKTNLTEL